MKVVFHTPLHSKNTDAIIKMCASRDIALEFTTDDARVIIPDYDILIMNAKFIDPDTIPASIKIIYGPQHFVFPHGPLVGPLNPIWSERCVFNCLSEWNAAVYKELAGSFKIPLTQLPYAVDIDKFCPSNNSKDIDCIIYIKRRQPDIIAAVKEEIHKFNDLKIQCYTYGQYREQDYFGALRRSKFMICIDAHESQGFAIEEALSCGVPLLVLNANTMHDEYDSDKFTYEGYKEYALTATSVPYWSDQCGIKINNVSEFPTAFAKMRESWASYKPRDYILSTLSPTVCMNRILNYFHLL